MASGISEFFNIGGYLRMNKIMARTLGNDAAILLEYLADLYQLFKNKDQLQKGGWFYRTQETIEWETGISKYKQRTAINLLKKLKFLDAETKGNPAKKYYKVSDEYLQNIPIFYEEYYRFEKDVKNGKIKISELNNLNASFKILRFLNIKILNTLYLYYTSELYLINKENFSKDFDENKFLEIMKKLSDQLKENASGKKIKKTLPKNLTPIAFVDTIQYLPDYLKSNEEFMKWWKVLFRYRKTQTPKSKPKPVPLTKKATTGQIREFEGFTIEEIIKSIRYMEEEATLRAFPRHTFNGNGKQKKLSPAEQPEPSKYAEPIIDYLEQFNPEPDIRLINQEVKKGEDYLEALYWKQDAASKKADKEKDSDRIQWAREWCEGLPLIDDVIKRYIDNLQGWAKDPSENLFKWDCDTFKKFRFHLQKNIFMRNWETGHRMS